MKKKNVDLWQLSNSPWIWFWVWHWPIITQLKLFVLQHLVGGKKVYCIATLSIHTSPESYISTFQPVAERSWGQRLRGRLS